MVEASSNSRSWFGSSVGGENRDAQCHRRPTLSLDTGLNRPLEIALGQDDYPGVIECWYFVLLPVSKLQELYLLNYSDVTQESIIITLFYSGLQYM
jgi:hypothetical protein